MGDVIVLCTSSRASLKKMTSSVLSFNCHDVICDAMCLMRIAFEAFPIANLLVGIMYS